MHSHPPLSCATLRNDSARADAYFGNPEKKPKNPPHPPGLGPPPHKLELIILQDLSRNFNEAILLLKYSPTVIPLNAVIISSNAISFSHLSSRVIAPISFHGEF